MYLAKINYKREDVTHILSSILKNIISDNTVVICIGTDRAIGDALGPLVGTMLKNSDLEQKCSVPYIYIYYNISIYKV